MSIIGKKIGECWNNGQILEHNRLRPTVRHYEHDDMTLQEEYSRDSRTILVLQLGPYRVSPL